jgi:general secretion pathway protein L
VSLTAAAAVGASAYIGMGLDARQEDLSRRIAQVRAAARAARNGSAEQAVTGLRALERRKHEGPSTVMALEALSQILPDHTYVTELRIEGDKVRLTGITKDAPSLIALIEQSGRFSRATFFAPTTRAPTDAGERFYIEAIMENTFGRRS